ncbi:translation initiation factor eif3 subunit 135 [Cystoisospora suis]|uniref:Translation initiation factor eif3 subunit 135 n=1 Tax=Cystoisospora suis TaxID=483139 RepID=A0A2C6KVV2_9APIC|nr:translation initiation factor eif3 subunit 135 [Cystoisospora suis]
MLFPPSLSVQQPVSTFTESGELARREHRIQQPRAWLIQEAEQLQATLLRDGKSLSEGVERESAVDKDLPDGDAKEKDSAYQLDLWQRERRKLVAGDDEEAAACMQRIRVRALEAVVSSQRPGSPVKSTRKRGGQDDFGAPQGDEAFEGVFPDLHVRTADCSIRLFGSIHLSSGPEEIFAMLPIPLFSPGSIYDALNEVCRQGVCGTEEGNVAWLRSPQHLCNKLLDSALSRDIAAAAITDQFDLSDRDTLYWHIFSSCQCISVSSAFAFVASNVALELVEKHVFQPSERFVLVGSLPFENSSPDLCRDPPGATQTEQAARLSLMARLQALQDRIQHASAEAFYLVHLLELERRSKGGGTLSAAEVLEMKHLRDVRAADALEWRQRRVLEVHAWSLPGSEENSLESVRKMALQHAGAKKSALDQRVFLDEETVDRMAFKRWKRRKAWWKRGTGDGSDVDSEAENNKATEQGTKDDEDLDDHEKKLKWRLRALEGLRTQWTGGAVEFSLLPDDHPFGVFKLFKFDKMFMARSKNQKTASAAQLAVLVLGDETHDVEEASKLYGIEIQAQRLINDAIVELKRLGSLQGTGRPTESEKPDDDATKVETEYLTVLQANLMTAVDYKGFRVVVLPLPAAVPKILAWPQPFSSQISQEVSFVEQRLNIASLVKSQPGGDSPCFAELAPKTMLLSLNPSSDDSIVFYRVGTSRFALRFLWYPGRLPT